MSGCIRFVCSLSACLKPQIMGKTERLPLAFDAMTGTISVGFTSPGDHRAPKVVDHFFCQGRFLGGLDNGAKLGREFNIISASHGMPSFHVNCAVYGSYTFSCHRSAVV